MQCLKRCGAALLAASAVILVAGALLVWRAPEWLNDPDAPDKAGAILILGGDSTRALEAADLYRAGYAPKIYISSPVRDARERRLDALGVLTPTEEDLTRQVLRKRDVPDEIVEVFARDVVSTVDEASASNVRFADVPGALLIVTSPYHVRRTRMIFRDAMPGRRLLFVANRYEPVPGQWWRDQTAARNIVLEISKTVYYLIGGRFRSAGVSAKPAARRRGSRRMSRLARGR
jgi:uncharacterized SAM-binding protein YcdF (DUF218 family)